MSKVNYTYDMCLGYLNNIIREMVIDDFRPDFIVGLTRGGLFTAMYLSHYFNLPMKTLHIALRDHFTVEFNKELADNAFAGKKILIVDDINDTGSTFTMLREIWEGFYTNKWRDDIWNNTTKFAVLIDNLASKSDIDYCGIEINKDEKPEWCVFPWEAWWRK